MKLPKRIILFFLVLFLSWISWVFAWWIDHFEVEFTPNKAKVNESMDLTIEAVDKNNETVLDYEWTILIFSESDPEAELPSDLEENTYTFTPEDQWKIKFENSVKFQAPWLQNIHIYDLNDDTVFWIAEATISEEEQLKNIDIEIVSPENGLTLWKSTISVSGTTQKNHQVVIILNWDKEFTTTSNSDWIFEKEITDLLDWSSVIEAKVLDADWNTVWTSDEVKIKVELNNLAIKNVKLDPASVEPEEEFGIEVIANQWLTTVEIIINDVITQLEETKSWVYTWRGFAPKEIWMYWADVKIQDQLGHKKTELWAANLDVSVKMTAWWDDNNSWWDDNNWERDLTITWLKLVELKTKSILTWDEIEDIEWYNIYKKLDNWNIEHIQKVDTAKFVVDIDFDEELTYEYFAVKAIAKNNKWEIYEWSLSDATKIKTWPEVIILLILSLLVGWFIFMKTRKTA